MIKLRLDYQDLLHRDLSIKLNIFQTNDPGIIQESIDNFNEEIDWENMFNLDIALNRISVGDKFFVAKHDENLFGYCWLKENSKNKYFIYNVFSKKLPKIREYGATDMLYFVIKNNTRGEIYSEVDKWNNKSINMFKKLGFTVIYGDN